MKLTAGQLEALRNLDRKKAGLDVSWIAIGDARQLTDLGFAARNRSGWQITPAGASVLALQELRPTTRPAAQLLAFATLHRS
ncbi:MAG TPA: hypothetical protein VMT68_05370 [Caulobacteraceae bacterium]|nr:hypothetical protein [Caulobacteraceae bacterium]